MVETRRWRWNIRSVYLNQFDYISSYSRNRKQLIENKQNYKLGCCHNVKTISNPQQERSDLSTESSHSVRDQWTHLRCRPGLGWTNRRRCWQVFLQGSRRSGPVASDLPPDRQCVSEPASMWARVGRRCCPAPRTAPGGHGHPYRHTTPESSKHGD